MGTFSEKKTPVFPVFQVGDRMGSEQRLASIFDAIAHERVTQKISTPENYSGQKNETKFMLVIYKDNEVAQGTRCRKYTVILLLPVSLSNTGANLGAYVIAPMPLPEDNIHAIAGCLPSEHSSPGQKEHVRLFSDNPIGYCRSDLKTI